MAELIIAVADLMEAEGRALRQNMMRTSTGIACLIAAALLLVAGISFCLWALLQWLEVALGVIAATLIVGICFLLLAGGLLWAAIRLSR